MTRRFLSSAAVIVTVVACVTALAGVLVEWCLAERTAPTLLVTYAPQALWLLLPAVGLVASAAARRLRLLGINVLLAALVVFGPMGFNIPRRNTDRPADLTVVTWNIRGHLAEAGAVAGQLAACDADVIVLQEARGVSLDGHLPDYDRASGGDVLILSRLPMKSHGEVTVGDARFRTGLWTSVSCQGRTIDVLGVHLSVLATRQSLRTSRSLRSRRAYLHQTAAARQAQAEGILRWAQARTNPVIVAGDFNTPPNGIVYRRIREYLDDAFASAGWGCGLTYSTGRPLWRIDYIFTQGFTAHSARVVDTTASDHRLVRGVLSFDGDRR